MTMTINDFRKLYNEKSAVLHVPNPSEETLQGDYKAYLALLKISGVDGDLHFKRVGKDLSWEFEPRRQ